MGKKVNILSNGITILLLLIGIVFLFLGIWREEYTIVMEKAINICLECIGIG
ncbi:MULTISPECIES: CD1871A family CXXC motif-containing protein [Blautia]|uniref:CD1871A family CXXC motif-containing protein n=1 Tax=Blautia TaxID=572511 RepID=UPI0018F86586|nr:MULTISPECIES: CD1871A family CXXC motif-containing protein [Blautia]